MTDEKSEREVETKAVKKARMLEVLGTSGGVLAMLSDEHQDDKDLVLAAVENYGLALQFASGELKNDFDVVLAAVTQDPNAIQFASEALQEDDEILSALPEDNLAIPYAFSEEDNNNKTIVLAAVQEAGGLLAYASEELRADKNIVWAAVTQDPLAIAFASAALQQDPDIKQLIATKKADTGTLEGVLGEEHPNTAKRYEKEKSAEQTSSNALAIGAAAVTSFIALAMEHSTLSKAVVLGAVVCLALQASPLRSTLTKDALGEFKLDVDAPGYDNPGMDI
ncbi:MAG: DUF4116 domain-containing protein [Gammaproteobacteria bacterium]|nr:DUF4116 domain-containing protein [Gammaproteobacteria bacterium]MCH9715630.1 DUF4116 domain-containing protein [Gammaproteobacteria bacterium]MCH9762897.1 DUF4116 domain-containing protein [Gammaproteobacteria bacterium]